VFMSAVILIDKFESGRRGWISSRSHYFEFVAEDEVDIVMGVVVVR